MKEVTRFKDGGVLETLGRYIYIYILLPQQQRGQNLVAVFQDHGDGSQVCHVMEQTLH